MADTNWQIRVGTKIDDSIQQQLNKLPVKSIVVTPVLKGGQEFQRTATQFVDGTGQMVQVTKDLNKATGTVSESITKVKQSTQAVSKEIQETSKHTATLGEKFVDVTKKVVAFGAVTSIIGLFTKTITMAVSSVKVLDASLTGLKKVSDLGAQSLEEYTERAFNMARGLSTTASNITDATTSFVQAGYELGEAEGLSKYAIMLQSIADNTMDTETATTFLTSTLKAFNMTASEAEHIISSVNEVSNKFSITSNDLSENIGKVAGVAGIAGVSFEELIGLMTASVEKTRNASKSANAFKSIFINLQQMDSSGTVPKLAKQFDEFGISMTDASGATKDAFDLLNELSVAYQRVSDSTDIEKQNKMKTLLEDIGGKYNYNVLISSLTGFETAISATETALNSTGSAQAEFDKAMDSIAKKSEAVKGAFQELVWGEGGLNSFIKFTLDGSTSIINFANDTDLLNVALIGIGATMATNLIPKFMSFLSTMYTTIGVFALEVEKTKSLSAGFKYIGVTANLAKIAINGLVAVLSIGALAYNKIKAEQERVVELSREQAKVSSDEAKALQEKIDLISDESTTRDQLVTAIKSVNDAYDSEIGAQKEINDLRQEGIDLLSEEAKQKAKSALLQMSSDISEATGGLAGTGETFRTKGVLGITPEAFLGEGMTMTGGSKSYIGTNLEATVNGLEQYGNALRDALEDEKYSTTQKIEIQKELDKVSLRYTELKDNLDSYTAIKEEEAKLIAIVNGTYNDLYDEQGNLIDSTVELSDETDSATESITEYELRLKALDSTLSVLSGTTLSGLTDAYDTLQKAQNESLSATGLSVETYEQLMNLGAEYQALLFDESGELRLNEESILAVYRAKIDEMAITSARNMIDLANTLSSEGQSFAELANNTNSATVAGWEQIAVMMAELELSEKDSNALQVRINGIKQWAEQAKKSVGTYRDTTKAISKQTKAIDEQKEALDKLKDEYKAVTEYIKDQLESEISRIEDAKSAELDRIDATIDALNKKRDAEEEYWDNRISALEAQNDATEKQIELEQLQENLALARNKKVMVMGANGWEVRSDEQAVAQAEQDIADYTRQQQAQTEIDILNKLKETALANYDSQIQAQEDFKTKQESAFDAQIQVLEGYKTEYNNMINAYDEDQNRLMALQVLGTDFEAQTWQTRLANLQDYVNRYNTLQASLSASVANSSSGSGDAVKIPPNTPTTQKIISATGGGGTRKIMAYASGVASVPDSGMSIIGDNPNNRELVIGGKLNGTATKLTSGSGVVNADSLKTWAGIMNGMSSALGLNGRTISANTTNQNSSTAQQISIANITLPSVTNGQGLLDELRGFSNNMMQKAYSNA